MAKGNSVGDKILRIRRRFSKRQQGTGYLYRGSIPASNKRFKHITVFAIFVSNEGGTLLRDHRFGFSDGGGRTRREWKGWLDSNYGGIVSNNILTKYQELFGGFWRLHTMIGWTAHVNKRARDTKTSTRRNKTKRKRR